MEESVGQVLLKLHDDISRLRERLEAGDEQQVRREQQQAIRDALAKADSDLRQRSRDALAQQQQPQEKQMVQTLPRIASAVGAEQQQQLQPEQSPIVIDARGARGGLLSLLERRVVPPDARVSIEPAPIVHRVVPMHDTATKARDRFPADCADPGYSQGLFMLQAQHDQQRQQRPRQQQQQQQQQQHVAAAQQLKPLTLKMRHFEAPLRQLPQLQQMQQELQQHAAADEKQQEEQQQQQPQQQQQRQQPEQKMLKRQKQQLLHQPGASSSSRIFSSAPPPPTTPASNALSRAGGDCRLVAQNARIKQDSSGYRQLQQRHQRVWPQVSRLLQQLQQLLLRYSVPLAFISGDKVGFLAAELAEDPDTRVEEDDLLDCLLNRSDVEGLLRRPGRQFAGPGGAERATVAIQAAWRGHRQRNSYRTQLRRQRAAIRVTEFIRRLAARRRLQRSMQQRRQGELLNYKQRLQQLGESWSRWSSRRRVVVHLPSLGHSISVRESLPDFQQRQAAQAARLCDARDPNVNVILVSAIPVDDEVEQYYRRLSGIGGKSSDGCSRRWRIVVPEAAALFPDRNFSLASLLLWSPRALRRIRNLISGRPAVIVPRVPSEDDVAVADCLKVPLLSPEPQVSRLYSTKSGSRRVLLAASVPAPPGDYDVYSLQQLLDSLAQLIVDNLDIQRWLLKLDASVDGRGIGCFEMRHLPCYRWALGERIRFGDKWCKKWAQEKVLLQVQGELGEALTKSGQAHYFGSFSKFLDEFLAHGGVIEAAPQADDSCTRLSADLCILPDGSVQLVCSSDQLTASGSSAFSRLGASIPQCSVQPQLLNDLCQRIGDACRQRRIFGHVSVDFVTFSTAQQQQVVWATDISLSYSDSVAMLQLLLLAADAEFLADSHEVISSDGQQRYATVSSRLRHCRLAELRYSALFQLCRAHGIRFDEADRTGSLFCLVDFFRRDYLCMMTLGWSLPDCLQTFARNLSVIQQEVQVPMSLADSNFNELLRELDSVIEAVKENEEVQEEEEEEEEEEKVQ